VGAPACAGVVVQDAILVNCSRGPVVDEVALVEHLKANPMFRAALDVFEVSHPHQTQSRLPCTLSPALSLAHPWCSGSPRALGKQRKAPSCVFLPRALP